MVCLRNISVDTLQKGDTDDDDDDNNINNNKVIVMMMIKYNSGSSRPSN
jgi:hypothetical protein